MRKVKNDLSIIINSCDKYSDLWFPFFSLFFRNWPDCRYSVYLNTETKKYFFDDHHDIVCLQLFDDDSVDWSSRLIETLKHIDTKYVLCMLDDEFIREPVIQSRLERLLSIMKWNLRISAIILDPPFTDEIYPFLRKSRLYKGLYPIPFARYNYNSANAALWRKSRLVHYLCSGESPWEFEVNTKNRLLYFDEFYYCGKDHNPIHTSFYEILGFGIYKGKWLWKNKELFDSFGIRIDYEKRGVKTIPQETVNKAITGNILFYKKQLQRSLKERVKDFVDRYRDIMPNWLRTFKHFINIIINKKHR